MSGSQGWRFDLKAGSGEIRARRIGRNELGAMQSLLAYHDAQMDYATQDHNGDGALEYAQKIFGESGKHDGLYWDDDGDGQVSSLGPLFGQYVSATPGMATTSVSSTAKARPPPAAPQLPDRQAHEPRLRHGRLAGQV